jgi:hypothetical protein
LETAMHKEIQSRYERATEPLPKTEYPQTCPLLSSFISRRESKRASGLVIQLADESEMAEMRRKELQDYAALKMHNKIYEELPLPRKAEVDRALQSGILPWERIPPMKQ